MTDTKNHSPELVCLQGRTFHPASIAEIAAAIEAAFDYRGDVTIELRSGERLSGYMFNRQTSESVGRAELFLAENGQVCEVSYANVVSIAFTGEDTASGKSWEAWVSKKESERRAEIERVAEHAKARGHL